MLTTALLTYIDCAAIKFSLYCQDTIVELPILHQVSQSRKEMPLKIHIHNIISAPVEQWFSTFLILCPFNTALHGAMTPTTKLCSVYFITVILLPL